MTGAGATTVVYVAGYGRSGSTLLGIVLGAHAGVMSLGEVGMLWDLVGKPDTVCTCGEPFSACPRWAPVIGAIEHEYSLAGLKKESVGLESWIKAAPGFLFGWRRPAGSVYGPASARFFQLLSGDGATRVFIDSSKTAYRFFWRPVALRRVAEVPVRMIHLVRDPRAVLASCMKGQNSRLAVGDDSLRPMASVIALIGWIVANVAARLNARRLGPGNCLLVEYEDLAAKPQQTLDRIGRFLGLDMESVQERMRHGLPFEAGHLAAGNRMAKAGVVFPQAHPLQLPRLGFWQRLGCALFALPLRAHLRRRASREQSA